MNTKRIDYLDMVKGIGIILVVIGHSGYCSYDVLTVIASFHMPLFFIVSGLLMRHIGEEKHSMKELIFKKARTILLPYAVFSVIYLLIYGGYFCLIAGSITPAFVKNMALESISLGGTSVLWFLTALFFAELFFLFFRKHMGHAVTIIITSVLALSSAMLRSGLDAALPVTNDLLRIVSYFLGTLCRSMAGMGFLMTGYYLYPLLQKRGKRWAETGSGVLGFAAVVLLGLWNGRTDLHFMVFGIVPVYFFCAVLGTVSLILLCRNIRPLRLLSYLGANSLIIMVTHLDCQFMLIAIRVGKIFVALSPYAKWYCLYFGMALTMLLLELAAIYVINHYLYFLIGHRKPKPKRCI